MSTPESLQRWEGTFKTTNAFYEAMGNQIQGNLRVYLADIGNAEYNTICELDYTGVYRNGQKLLGTVYVRKEHMSVTIPPSQKVLFTITKRDSTALEGSYSCVVPHDSGVFTLKRA